MCLLRRRCGRRMRAAYRHARRRRCATRRPGTPSWWGSAAPRTRPRRPGRPRYRHPCHPGLRYPGNAQADEVVLAALEVADAVRPPVSRLHGERVGIDRFGDLAGGGTASGLFDPYSDAESHIDRSRRSFVSETHVFREQHAMLARSDSSRGSERANATGADSLRDREVGPIARNRVPIGRVCRVASLGEPRRNLAFAHVA